MAQSSQSRQPNQRSHARRATEGERELAILALGELDNRRLEVVLIPAPEPKHSEHKVRAVQGTNPDWYRSLCACRPRSASIRKYVVKALERVAEGWVDPGPWSIAQEVLDVLYEDGERIWGVNPDWWEEDE